MRWRRRRAGALRAGLDRDRVESALDINERAAQHSKSAVGRSLNATKAGMTQDYSLAHTIARAKVAYGDKFGPETRALIERLTKERDEAVTAAAEKAKKPAGPKKTPDEKMQARVKAQIDKLEGQIKERLSSCPIP
jgi:DNA anti-recombination protein RmuC